MYVLPSFLPSFSPSFSPSFTADNLQADANMDNDDPTALALIEELECGMCAGVFIDVSDSSSSALPLTDALSPLIARRSERMWPRLLRQLCPAMDQGERDLSSPLLTPQSIPRYPVSLLPGDPVPEPIACPHCRHAPIQTATPSRVAKSMVTFLLGRMPSVSRPPNELRQAKDIYTSNHGVLKVS
jgi:hypothetical protein